MRTPCSIRVIHEVRLPSQPANYLTAHRRSDRPCLASAVEQLATRRSDICTRVEECRCERGSRLVFFPAGLRLLVALVRTLEREIKSEFLAAKETLISVKSLGNLPKKMLDTFSSFSVKVRF